MKTDQTLAVVIFLLSGLFVLGGKIQAAQTDSSIAPPKRVKLPKLTGALNVDGQLNEEVWRKAAILTPFYRNDGSGPGKELTELRLWYDDNALYLGWVCIDSDIQATFTNRDSKFWEEEVAEMFLTSGELTKYFELQWNPLGGIFDAIITNRLDEKGKSKDFNGNWDFTAGKMRSAVAVAGTVGKSDDRDTKWQVEVVVPFSDLDQTTPKKGDTWRGNFYRFNRTRGQPPEMLSWSPTLDPSFHQPSRFGYLEFGG